MKLWESFTLCFVLVAELIINYSDKGEDKMSSCKNGENTSRFDKIIESKVL